MRREELVEAFIRRKTVYRGGAVDFMVDQIRLPNGRAAQREFLSHPGAVGVLPFWNRTTLLLVRQYRYPVRRITCEIPAGKLSAGESPLSCARRELSEETGCTARRVRRLTSYWPTPAFSNEVLHLYLAEELTQGPITLDEDEFLEVVRVPFHRALDWVLSGKIRDSKTVIAILAYQTERNK